MPFAAVDYLGLDYGVKGPGEIILCELARRLVTGNTPAVLGLIINYDHGKVTRVPMSATISRQSSSPLLDDAGYCEPRSWQVNTTTSYRRYSGEPFKVDNVAYYRKGGLGNILTKNGCVMACTHCVEPDAKGNFFTLRSRQAVVDEMESLTDQGIYDIHTTDSEFNLSLANTKALLSEIIRRRRVGSSLEYLRLWIYAQPEPFDDELADLLEDAGCAGVNVSTDHVRDQLLNGWKVDRAGRPFYSAAAVNQVVDLCRNHGMLTMIEVLLGMPGETLVTLSDCVDQTMAMDATVVGFTLGLRIFPYSPLGMWCAEQCAGTTTTAGVQSNTAASPIVLRRADQCESPVQYERQFMFDEDDRIRPLYYFSPALPEDPETISKPNGRWLKTVQFLWEHIPEQDYPRVMLPTAPGITENDNNYADNPFLVGLVGLGYKGAFWAHWRNRESILGEARVKGLI